MFAVDFFYGQTFTDHIRTRLGHLLSCVCVRVCLSKSWTIFLFPRVEVSNQWVLYIQFTINHLPSNIYVSKISFEGHNTQFVRSISCSCRCVCVSLCRISYVFFRLSNVFSAPKVKCASHHHGGFTLFNQFYWNEWDKVVELVAHVVCCWLSTKHIRPYTRVHFTISGSNGSSGNRVNDRDRK